MLKECDFPVAVLVVPRRAADALLTGPILGESEGELMPDGPGAFEELPFTDEDD